MENENIGLVLEGGGMRGAYTCGVLEFFIERQIYFSYVIGVSAGACNAMSYISGQRGRNEKINLNFINDKRYMSIKNFIKEGSFFGMDFIFNEIPNKHIPFDFKSFYGSPCKFLIGTTDCNTGKPIYFTKDDIDEKFNVLRASSSLPLVSPIVNFKGYELLDGGLSDAIPIKKSIEDGNGKNIIVLTRNKNYRKTPNKLYKILEVKYKNYPKLLKTLKYRYKNYNQTLDYIDVLEKEGKVLVLRPSKPLNVEKFEKNPRKLTQLLENGYEDAKKNYKKIITFMGEENTRVI